MVLMWNIFLFFLTSSHLSVKKLQLVLTPFSSFFPLSLDEGMSEKTTLLSHSFQQLDRIDSLSEQIGFLEERLGTCEWLHRLTLFIVHKLKASILLNSTGTWFPGKVGSVTKKVKLKTRGHIKSQM